MCHRREGGDAVGGSATPSRTRQGVLFRSRVFGSRSYRPRISRSWVSRPNRSGVLIIVLAKASNSHLVVNVITSINSNSYLHELCQQDFICRPVLRKLLPAPERTLKEEENMPAHVTERADAHVMAL